MCFEIYIYLSKIKVETYREKEQNSNIFKVGLKITTQRYRVVCPRFKQPIQSSDSFKLKSEFLRGKNNEIKIVNRPLVFKLLQLSNGDYFFP